MVVVLHILVQRVFFCDRHREACILHFLDCHLTIAVGSDMRDVFGRYGIRSRCRCRFLHRLLFLCQTECSISLVRITVFESVDEGVFSGGISILTRGRGRCLRVRIGDPRLKVGRATCLPDDVLHVRLIMVAVQEAVQRYDVVGVRNATVRISDNVSLVWVRAFDVRVFCFIGIIAPVNCDVFCHIILKKDTFRNDADQQTALIRHR